MSTRMSVPTVPVLTRRIGDLAREKAEIERQLIAALEANRQLRGSLSIAMIPYTGHKTHVVNGVLTVTLGSGEVYQRVQRVIDRPGESGYAWHWQRLAPVPTSPAALIQDALANLPEMSVVEGDEDSEDSDNGEPSEFALALEASL